MQDQETATQELEADYRMFPALPEDITVDELHQAIIENWGVVDDSFLEGEAHRLAAVYQSLTARDLQFLDVDLDGRVEECGEERGEERGPSELVIRSEGGQWGNRCWEVRIEFRMTRGIFNDYPVERPDWRALTRGWSWEKVLVRTFSEHEEKWFEYVGASDDLEDRPERRWGEAFARAAWETYNQKSVAQDFGLT